MRLATIVAELNEVEMVGLGGSPSSDDLEITDVNFDSRQVRAGSLFCCVPGVSDDGHLHAGDAVAAEFAKNTEEAIATNVFGAPWYSVDGEGYWGQDRLEFVERALMGK